jgi:hypothetical protein
MASDDELEDTARLVAIMSQQFILNLLLHHRGCAVALNE